MTPARPHLVLLCADSSQDRIHHLYRRRTRQCGVDATTPRRQHGYDLAGTPTAGLQVQLCGDAHLSIFGVFASPERWLLFDLDDFDETLPGRSNGT